MPRPDPSTPLRASRSGQALRLRPGQALRLRPGQALRLRSGQAAQGKPLRASPSTPLRARRPGWHGLLLSLALCIGAGLAHAEAAPIQIEADHVELDHAGQTSVYRGRVRLTQVQGTLEADVMTLRHRAGRVERVEAEGKPARFTQPAQAGSQAVVATAARMRYSPDSGELVLDGAGQLKQGESLLKSEHIVYDTRASRLRAGGEGGGRVRITIEPERLHGATPR